MPDLLILSNNVRRCNRISRNRVKLLTSSVMTFARLAAAVFTLLIVIATISAQEDVPIRVESSIVRLNVGVVDQRGRPVTTLSKANFEVYEDGVKQEITRFEPTEAPFSV